MLNHLPIQLGGGCNERIPSFVHSVTISWSSISGLKPGRQEYRYWSSNCKEVFVGTGTVFVPFSGEPHSTAKQTNDLKVQNCT